MSDRRPKVTVEELLHLKRAERPDAEFWSHFDRELRAKQLAALVARRPWWDVSWTRLRGALLRVVAPLGAAAAGVLAGLNFASNQSTVLQPLATHTRVALAPAVANASETSGRAPAQTTVVLAQNSTQPPPVAAPESATPAVAVVEAVAEVPPFATAAQSRPAATTLPVAVNGSITLGRTDFTVPMTPSLSALVAELDAFPVTSTLSEFPAVIPADSVLPPEQITASSVHVPTALQIVSMARPSNAFWRQAVASTEAQARERVRRRLANNLPSGASGRRLIDLEGSSVSVRF